MKRVHSRIVLLFLGLLLCVAIPVSAAGLIPCEGLNCKVSDLVKLLVNIYNYLLGLAGLAALLFIIISGIKRIYFSFLDDSASHLEEAKHGLTQALVGLFLIATAYVVVNTLILVLTGNVYNLSTFFSTVLKVPGVF